MSQSFGQSNFGYNSNQFSPSLITALNLIPANTWTYISIINQGLATTSSPTFYDATITNELKLADSGFNCTVSTAALTADRTFILPNFAMSFDQSLLTSDSPVFTKLGINGSIETTEQCLINGDLKLSNASKLIIKESGFLMSIYPQTLAADRTLTIQDASIELTPWINPDYLKSDGVSITSYGYQAVQQMAGNTAATAIGWQAMNSSTAATDSTALGWRSMFDLTTGIKNTAIGSASGNTNQTGDENCFLGYNALATSTSCSYGIAIGAGSKCSTSSICIGRNIALNSNSSATQNVLIGGNGNSAALTSGDSNVIVGSAAGSVPTTGYLNVLVGYNCDTTAVDTFDAVIIGQSAVGGSNAVSIGAGASAATDTITIGNASHTDCRLYGQIGLNAPTAITTTSTTNGTTTFTLSTRTGYYQQIGNWMHFTITMSWLNQNGAGAAQMRCAGLPWTNGASQSVSILCATATTLDVRALAVSATNEIYFYKMEAAANALIPDDLNTSGNYTLTGVIYVA